MGYIALGDLISKAQVEKCGKREYPVLSMTMHDGIVFQNDRFKKDIASIDRSNYSIVGFNQLVVSFPIDEGVLAVQDITDAGIVSPAYKIWDIDQAKLVPKYLEMWLRSPRSIDYYKSKLRGTTARRRSIPEEDFLGMRVNVPPKEEQERIVNLLTRVKGVILLREQEMVALDDLIKARFVEMFGDPVSNPYGLLMKKLSELGSLDRGRSQHRPRNAPELLNGPYPLIQTGEVAASGLYITKYQSTYSELGLKQSRMWKAGTLCITIAANIAQTAIMTFDACFPDSVIGFVPNSEVSAVYMHYWFGFFQKILEEQAPQVAQKNINLKILSDLNVIVPDQNQLSTFEDFVMQIDKSKYDI